MVDLANAFSFNTLLDFIFGNIIWIGLIAGVGFLLYNYLRVSSKPRIKPVERSEVERVRFIERLKHNDTEFKYLFRGKTLIGSIRKLTVLNIFVPTEYDKKKKKGRPQKEEKDEKEDPKIKEDPKTDENKVRVIQLVVKPVISRILRIPNPLAKDIPFQIKLENVEIDNARKVVNIPYYVYLDRYYGIYYDKNNEFIHTANIIKDNVLRTDIDNMAGIYFAKSQEQATFDPDHAHSLALKEKEIQLELAKRSSKLSQI